MMTGGDAGGKVIKEGFMHFSLGENLGDIVTQIVREKAWYQLNRDGAILSLISSLPGITRKQCEQVIDGTLRLKTNKDKQTMRLVKDNYAPPDLKKMREEVEDVIEKAEFAAEHHRIGRNRLFITGNEEEEILHEVRELREMADLNIWKAHASASSLLRWVYDFHNANREQLYREYKDLKKEPEGEEEPEKHDTFDEMMKDIKTGALVQIEGMNLDPEQKRRMQRLVLSEGHDPDLKEDPGFESDTGWLDRKGKYWGCELGLHIPLAGKLVKEFFPDHQGDAEQKLEAEGWMKCTGGRWYETEKPPTAEQRWTFKQWEKKHTTKKYTARGDY